MAIQRTFWDGNPEDRNYAADYWSWLKDQPQTVWLNAARGANWDQLDSIFVDMVKDPACDRALASWLFWRSNPAYFVAAGKRPPRDDLLGAILSRAEAGGWPSGALHYARAEVALGALGTAEAIARSTATPFAVPRELIASFEGKNPSVGPFDAETEAGLAELYRHFDGELVRDEQVYHRREREHGNRWYESALLLPAAPAVTERMSDDEAIEAVFGPWRESLDRVERARRAASGQQARSGGVAPLVNPDRTQLAIGLGFIALSLSVLAWVGWRWMGG